MKSHSAQQLRPSATSFLRGYSRPADHPMCLSIVITSPSPRPGPRVLSQANLPFSQADSSPRLAHNRRGFDKSQPLATIGGQPSAGCVSDGPSTPADPCHTCRAFCFGPGPGETRGIPPSYQNWTLTGSQLPDREDGGRPERGIVRLMDDSRHITFRGPNRLPFGGTWWSF